MATLNWPGFGLASISPTLDQPSQSNSSAWTGKRTVVANPWHGKWSFQVTLATRQGDAAFQAARAFFTSLKGQINTFHLPAVEAPQNANTGVTMQGTAVQGATIATLTGVTTALVAGNMATVNGQLLSIITVGALVASAQNITFQPALRAAATAGTAVETAKPYALVYLSDSSFTWDIGSWRRYGLTFNAAEAVSETDGADPALDVWTGGVGSGGGSGTSFTFPQLTSFISRSLLAAVVGPTDKQIAELTETGREGKFIFSTSNHSAHVTADPQQGIYVAPSSDTSGASGAWVRQWSVLAISLWWGVATGNTAAQNVTAYRAALTLLAVVAQTGYGYINGSAALYTPTGHYLFNDELAPQSAVDNFGDSSRLGGGTVFEWTASSGHGFNLQGYDGALRHSMGSKVRKLHLKGWFSGTRSDQHGVYVNGQSQVDDIFCEYWPGKGVRGFGDTGTSNGNINGSVFRNIFGQFCDKVLELQGGDSSACEVYGISGANNRFGTYHDFSFLGNKAFGPSSEDDCINSSFPTRCHLSGFIYIVAYGQETWCSTHTPTGTATSNQGWLYFGTGTANSYTPTWTTGLTWYWGAPICIGPPGNGNTLGSADACYIESVNPVILDTHTRCTTTTVCTVWMDDAGGNRGVLHGGHFRGNGTAMMFNNNIVVPGSVTAAGANHEIGPKTGTAADLAVNFHTTNFTVALTATSWSAGVPTTMGGIQWFNGTYYIDGKFGGSFRYNSVVKATVTTDGLLLPSGANLTFTEIAAASVTTPAASTQTLFIDSADHKLKRKDSSGTVTIIA